MGYAFMMHAIEKPKGTVSVCSSKINKFCLEKHFTVLDFIL